MELSKKSGGEILPQVSGSDLDPVKERWVWSVFVSGVSTTLLGQSSENPHNSRKLNRGCGSPRSKIDHIAIYDNV